MGLNHLIFYTVGTPNKEIFPYLTQNLKLPFLARFLKKMSCPLFGVLTLVLGLRMTYEVFCLESTQIDTVETNFRRLVLRGV